MLELPLQILQLNVLILGHFNHFVGLGTMVDSTWPEAVFSQLFQVEEIQLGLRVPLKFQGLELEKGD